jgi:hypothetical protein
MSGRECSCFIEKEQLGPTSTCHDDTPASLELTLTGQPAFGRPSLPKKRSGSHIVNDPAVSSERATLRNSANVPKRGNPILIRQVTRARPCAAILLT